MIKSIPRGQCPNIESSTFNSWCKIAHSYRRLQEMRTPSLSDNKYRIAYWVADISALVFNVQKQFILENVTAICKRYKFLGNLPLCCTVLHTVFGAMIKFAELSMLLTSWVVSNDNHKKNILKKH